MHLRDEFVPGAAQFGCSANGQECERIADYTSYVARRWLIASTACIGAVESEHNSTGMCLSAHDSRVAADSRFAHAGVRRSVISIDLPR
jgi:hypothetical protein